jgi:hypothetical protein
MIVMSPERVDQRYRMIDESRRAFARRFAFSGNLLAA